MVALVYTVQNNFWQAVKTTFVDNKSEFKMVSAEKNAENNLKSSLAFQMIHQNDPNLFTRQYEFSNTWYFRAFR